jgi:hypothetical protein
MYSSPPTLWQAYTHLASTVERASGNATIAPWLVSRRKPAFQSGTPGPQVASMAVDGSLTQDWCGCRAFAFAACCLQTQHH